MFSAFDQSDLRFGETSTSSSVEPMTLGSPVSSPKSKTNASQNYLPPYLFGEVNSSPVGPSSWSSPKQLSMFPSSTFPSTPVSQFREQQVVYQSPVSSSIIGPTNPAKSGGPPIQGLLYSSTSPVSSFDFSNLNGTPKNQSIQVVSAANNSHNVSGILTPSKSFSVNNSTFLSPAQIDPFFTQGDALKDGEQLDESWVTVFGFPSASSSYILQQFSQYGNIIEHKISPIGNWMHLRYQSKLQAKKALSKNGKIFSGNIMVGVKPCIEMDLMDSTKENSVLDVTSPLSNSTIIDNLEPSKPNLKNIRPLTQAYQSPKTPTQATTPKSGGIVSKAMEYLWKR